MNLPSNPPPLPWPQSNSPNGTNFQAIHMAVIPNTTKVIVWDSNGQNQGLGFQAPWPQRFAVGDPVTGVFDNYVVQVPAGWGDLFCSGHCWLPDGKLFVAGGNTRYTPHFEGSQLAAIWNPVTASAAPNHGWTWLPPMHKKRWYPTATLIIDTGNQPRVMVSGGVESTTNDFCVNGTGPGGDGAFNTYEVWNIAANDWERVSPTSPPTLYDGPTFGTPAQRCWTVLGEYPRMHLLTTNRVFLAGMFTGANRVRHDELLGPPQIWEASQPGSSPWTSSPGRHYGSSILLPNVGNSPGGQNLVMIVGGGDGATQTVVGDNRVIDAGAVNPVWSQSDPNGDPYASVHPRMMANVVLLPTGEVVAIGGCSNFYDYNNASANLPVFDTEIFSKTSGWVVDASQPPQISSRMYHSTAALLPSGHVVSAGGELAERTSDYEIYSPPCLNTGQARPDFAGTWSRANPGHVDMFFGQTYVIDHATLPVGVTVSRVVLMRPCSTTHHSDMDQRYVELETLIYKPPQYPPVDTITVRAPAGPTGASMEAPPGFYMAFLISSQGVPSQAKWVWLR